MSLGGLCRRGELLIGKIGGYSYTSDGGTIGGRVGILCGIYVSLSGNIPADPLYPLFDLDLDPGEPLRTPRLWSLTLSGEDFFMLWANLDWWGG